MLRMKTRSLSGRNVAGYVATIGRKVLSAVAFAEAPYENDSQSRATGDGQAIPILVLFSKLVLDTTPKAIKRHRARGVG
jgi:hypothetical protein